MELSANSPKLPGFDLPIDYTPGSYTSLKTPANNKPQKWPAYTEDGLFPNALSGQFLLGLTTVREFRMLQAMDAITDKAGWESKVMDSEITSKWKAELVSSDAGTPGGMTEKMAEYVIAELQHKADQFRNSGFVVVYDADVVKSDSAVSPELRSALRKAVALLEDVPDADKDWHPGSEEQVLDLVHPSLFPLVYGRSRVLPRERLGLDDVTRACGKGVRTAWIPAKFSTDDRIYSRKFQWLPCEVAFEGDEESAKISSYINNLHPDEHPKLYALIAQFVDRAIPLWNQALAGWPAAKENFKRIIYKDAEYTVDRELAEDRPVRGDDEEEDDWMDREEEWWDDTKLRHLIYPEPEEFKPRQTDTTVNLKEDYGSLQVIVKLANIHLTPDKPSYEGGNWHVEGHNNEHICATALYYYDSVNITESRLGFRQSSDIEPTEGDIGYEQNDHEWLEAIFGCENEDQSTQEMGSVVCKEGRLLAFPNLIQHRVLPFELADHSRSGHRKILALFLVDPNIHVISTANVPPQQKGPWAERLRTTTALGNLPPEIFDHTIELVDDFPISLAEAKTLREELMEERGPYASKPGEKWSKSDSFFLCEH